MSSLEVGTSPAGADARGLAAALAPARAWWRQLAARERRALGVAAAVLVLGLLWQWGIAPAWRTLVRAPAELERLDAQLQQMRALAAETEQLRATPALVPGQAQQALKAASDRLGPKARLVLQGDRAVLTLTGVEPQALRDWLAEARSGARARVVEAQLSRANPGFNGTVVVQLGGAP